MQLLSDPQTRFRQFMRGQIAKLSHKLVHS